MSRCVIEGMFWSAGDSIFIDIGNEKEGWTAVRLNDALKRHIKEDSRVIITIDIKDDNDLMEDLLMEQKEQM